VRRQKWLEEYFIPGKAKIASVVFWKGVREERGTRREKGGRRWLGQVIKNEAYLPRQVEFSDVKVIGNPLTWGAHRTGKGKIN